VGKGATGAVPDTVEAEGSECLDFPNGHLLLDFDLSAFSAFVVAKDHTDRNDKTLMTSAAFFLLSREF